MNRVVLVTGGARHRASVALAFAVPGTVVAVNYRSDGQGAASVVDRLAGEVRPELRCKPM